MFAEDEVHISVAVINENNYQFIRVIEIVFPFKMFHFDDFEREKERALMYMFL